MRHLLVAQLAVLAASVATAEACSTGSDAPAGAAPVVEAGASTDAPDDVPEPDAAPDGGSDTTATTSDATDNGTLDAPFPDYSAQFPYALLRIANWSPTAPAVDVCTAPHGTGTFTGPIIAGLLDDEDGGTIGEAGATGLPFPLASSYLTVTPGVLDVRLVAGGSSSCATAVVPDVTTPSLAQGSGTTMALVGEVGPVGGGSQTPGLSVVTFADEILDDNGPLRLRFINASPDMAFAAFGTGSLASDSLVTLFPAVPYGQFGSAWEADATVPGVDALGYRFATELVGTIVSAHDSSLTSDAVVTMPVTTTTGIPLTVVLVGAPSVGEPYALLECLDSAGTAGAMGACSVLP